MSTECPNRILRSVSLAIYLCVYLTEGINLTVLALIFPPFAQNLGLSATQVGLIQSAFDVSSLACQVFLGSLIQPPTVHVYFTLGIATSSLSMLLFGLTGYLVDPKLFFLLTFIDRVVMGLGASLVYACAIPMVNRTFPESHNFLASTTQTAMGLGCVLGPSVGSFLYHRVFETCENRFAMVFCLVGMLELILTCILVVLPPIKTNSRLQSTKEVKLANKERYTAFLKDPKLLIISAALIAITSIVGFRNVSYSPYLTSLGFEDHMGWIFTCSAMAFMISAPLFGILNQKGFLGFAMTSGMVGVSTVYLLISLPAYLDAVRSEIFMGAVFVFEGVAVAAVMSSAYLTGRYTAQKRGFPDSEKLSIMASSWINTVRFTGRILGALLVGGILMDVLSFQVNCAIMFLISAVCSLFAFFIFKSVGIF